MMFIFVPGLNAESLSSLDFGDYSEYEIIDTESTLPTASVFTVEKIYKIGSSYYITEVVSTGGTKTYLSYGDNIIDSNDIAYLTYDLNYQSDCSDSTNIRIGSHRTNKLSSMSILSRLTYDPNANTFTFYNFNTASVNYNGVTNGVVLDSNNTVFTFNLYSNYAQYMRFVVDSECTVPLYYIANLVVTYEWKEITPTTVISYVHDDKDFYLFYTFDQIKEFDIFNEYNFYDFTDFQKIIVVLGVNGFYLCFIGFIVYLFIKLINKVITWLKELF